MARMPLLMYINDMDTEPDLRTASRETVLAMIAQQEATIAQLQQRDAALETRLNTPGVARNAREQASQSPEVAPEGTAQTATPRLRPEADGPN